MGLENIAVMMYDDPVLIEDMMEHLTELSLSVMEKALNEVQFDFASGWEDMAYNHGPMISPAMIKKYMVPRYKRITDVLHKHGIDVIYVDCDGDINEMVPLFLEGGINCMFPIEVNSGTDPVELRRRYGKDILLLGGVNKIELGKGKREIENEIKRIAPVVEEGGYIPHVDHRCPPTVSYENYLYYLELKRKAFCS
jgi:uroporphyrinogen decarboxylase